MKAAWLSRLKQLVNAAPAEPSELQRACDLIAAVDRGGIPLNPARVNQIARGLGLEVSSKAPVEDTIARIRASLARR